MAEQQFLELGGLDSARYAQKHPAALFLPLPQPFCQAGQATRAGLGQDAAQQRGTDRPVGLPVFKPGQLTHRAGGQLITQPIGSDIQLFGLGGKMAVLVSRLGPPAESLPALLQTGLEGQRVNQPDQRIGRQIVPHALQFGIHPRQKGFDAGEQQPAFHILDEALLFPVGELAGRQRGFNRPFGGLQTRHRKKTHRQQHGLVERRS